MAAWIGQAGALSDAVTVTAERLNVRTEASVQSKSVAVVSKDETLQFVSASGDWIRVMASGKAGYVVEPEPARIADGLVDFFENNRQEEFIRGIEDEKRKYSWSNMTDAVRRCAE